MAKKYSIGDSIPVPYPYTKGNVVKALSDGWYGVEVDDGKVIDIKEMEIDNKNSYGNYSIQADLDKGVSIGECIRRVRERYPDIDMNQAQEIVEAIAKDGENAKTDWSHKGKKNAIITVDDRRNKGQEMFGTKKNGYNKDPLWKNGTSGNGKYIWEAKVYDEGSNYGIEGGRVSKLWVQDRVTREVVLEYDRGWSIGQDKKDIWGPIVSQFK